VIKLKKNKIKLINIIEAAEGEREREHVRPLDFFLSNEIVICFFIYLFVLRI
jgi:hypothetical protein